MWNSDASQHGLDERWWTNRIEHLARLKAGDGRSAECSPPADLPLRRSRCIVSCGGFLETRAQCSA